MTKYENTDEKDKSNWKLTENWQSNFRYISKNDIIKTENCLDLLTEKGVYPHDYMKNNYHLHVFENFRDMF